MSHQTSNRGRSTWPSALAVGLAVGSVLVAQVFRVNVAEQLSNAVPWSKRTDAFRILLAISYYAGLWGGGLWLMVAWATWRWPLARWRFYWWAPAVFLLGALARFATPNMAMNTAPDPDGIHYALSALSLVNRGSFQIAFGKDWLPSRMPPGPSLIMCLTQWLNPNEPGWGIFAIWLTGCATLWLVWHLGRRRFNHRVAATALGLLALSPIHIHYSKELMGEVPWAFFVLAGIALLTDPMDHYWTAGLGGIVLGLAMLFKPPHVFLLAGLALSFLARRMSLRSMRRAAIFLGATGVAAMTCPLYNRIQFGDWWITGYHLFHSTTGASKTAVYSLSYALLRPPYGGILGNAPYYTLVLLGLEPRPERMIWPMPIALSALAAVARWRRWPMPEGGRTMFRLVAASFALYGIPLVTYAFQHPRFFMPFLPFLFLYAAHRMQPLLDSLPQILRRLVALAVPVALAAYVLAAWHAEWRIGRTNERALWQQLAEAVKGYDVLVTDAEPALLTFYRVWTPPRKIIPLLPPNEEWLAEEPLELLRRLRRVVAPHPGTIAATSAALQKGLRVAVWLRRYHYAPAVYDEFFSTFDTRMKPETGVPHFGEVAGLRTNTR